LLPDPRIATKYNFDFVKQGEVVAIGKVIPVEIPLPELNEIKKIANSYNPVIDLLPIQKNRIAIFPVGNEFLEGRKEEVMSLKVKAYLESFGQEVFMRKILPDDSAEITNAGISAINAGADILIYMGGLAVDPDDKTVEGMLGMGLDSYIYGIPMWPGMTFFIGYKQKKFVLGIPSSAGLVNKGTSFHRLISLFLAHYHISKEEVTEMAVGGLLNAGNL
jgi:molybdopterin biosynthesis enzyme